MRSRIPPAVLAMAIAASAPTPLDHGILTPAQVDGEPPRQKRQRKPQLSNREPRRARKNKYPYGRVPDPQRQQAAADKRDRKAQKRANDQLRTAFGIIDAHNKFVDRERHERLYVRRGRPQ